MRPLVFLDTETTGLHTDRQPWEIALIRRDDTGDTRTVLYVDLADLDLDAAEPAGLRVSRFSKIATLRSCTGPSACRRCTASATPR